MGQDMNLEDVQPGDTLIWHTDFGQPKQHINVIRVTKTLIITKCFKFRKSDGYRIGPGASMNRSRVTIPQPGEIAEIGDKT